MRRKTISNAKLIVTVKSNKGENKIETVFIFDNRINRNWTDKETLNWNLNGDSSKYQFKWGQTGKYNSEGKAYIFD